MSKTYTFSGMMTISVHLDVEAASLKEAVELMREASVMSLCHQCADGVRGEWSTSGELDSEVTNIDEITVDGEPLTEAQLKRAKKMMGDPC